MTEYKSNSFKSKEKAADKRVEKVITGNARLKKKSGFQKLSDIFISEDIGNIKSYILLDIVIPTVKKTISEIIINGTDMILYGSNGGRKKSNASKISYREYYNENNRRNSGSRSRGVYDYDNLIVNTRGEAEEILSGLDEIITQYRIASVADLYDLAGVTANHTDYNYGWKDIHTASVARVRDGYTIKLPRPIPIN